MKAFSSFCMFIALVGTLHASPGCERLSHYNPDNLQKSFEMDLVSNVWNTAVLGFEATLYFQKDGSLLSVPADDAGVKLFNWSVDVQDGQALLYLNDTDRARVFSLAPTCSGLCISDGGKCDMMSVSAESVVSVERLNFVRSQISGSWKYEPSRKDARNGRGGFTMTLGKDGTFSISTGPDTYHSVLEGNWQLAPDGEYLIIFTKQYGKQHIAYVPEALAIQSIDYEDLVIDSERMPKILEGGAKKQPLYLSRVKA